MTRAPASSSTCLRGGPKTGTAAPLLTVLSEPLRMLSFRFTLGTSSYRPHPRLALPTSALRPYSVKCTKASTLSLLLLLVAHLSRLLRVLHGPPMSSEMSWVLVLLLAAPIMRSRRTSCSLSVQKRVDRLHRLLSGQMEILVIMSTTKSTSSHHLPTLLAGSKSRPGLYEMLS